MSSPRLLPVAAASTLLALTLIPASPAVAAPGCGKGTLHLVASPLTAKERAVNGADALRPDSLTLAGYIDKTFDLDPIIVRWNGSVLRRERVRERQVGRDAEFDDVTVLKGGAGWAVGHYQTDEGERALIRTRVNRVWRVTDPPPLRGRSTLNGAVDASSTDNVWAVGYQRGGRRPAVIRWNGDRWRTMRIPRIEGADRHVALGVDAVSRKNVWISTTFTKNGVTRARVYHWNGEKFRPHVLPQPSDSLNIPNAIAVGSPTNIWVAGQHLEGVVTVPTFWHYDGDTWTHIAGPTVSGESHQIADATVVKGRLLAVGEADDGGPVALLIRSTVGGTDLTTGAPTGDPGELSAIGVAEGTNVAAAGGSFGGTLIAYSNCS